MPQFTAYHDRSADYHDRSADYHDRSADYHQQRFDELRPKGYRMIS